MDHLEDQTGSLMPTGGRALGGRSVNPTQRPTVNEPVQVLVPDSPGPSAPSWQRQMQAATVSADRVQHCVVPRPADADPVTPFRAESDPGGRGGR